MVRVDKTEAGRSQGIVAQKMVSVPSTARRKNCKNEQWILLDCMGSRASITRAQRPNSISSAAYKKQSG